MVYLNKETGNFFVTRLRVSCRDRSKKCFKIEDITKMAREDDYKSRMEDADGVVRVESNLIKRKASSSWCDVGANLSDSIKRLAICFP